MRIPDSTTGQRVQFCTAKDGANIAYAISGEGTPLVRAAHYLSHLEFDFESPVWRHWIRELSRNNTYIRYDERGCGLSDQDPPEFSFDAWVSDLETVVDTLKLGRFDLLGVSQGGAVAITYAVKHPERVSRLILYGAYARGWGKRTGPGGSPRALETREAMHRLVELGWGQDTPAFRQMFTSLFVPDGGEEQQKWFNELQRVSCSPANAFKFDKVFADIDVTRLLSRVSVPTLILHARHDGVVPFEEGRLLASQIPGSRFISFEGRNHILLETEPGWEIFLRELRRFMGVAAGTTPRGPMEAEPNAEASIQVGTQVASLTELDLPRFNVVGSYSRYDERTRNLLKDFRHRVKNGFDSSSPTTENYLLWGPPGTGKTHLIRQIAASIASATYREINLAESSEEHFRSSLDHLELEGRNVICLIDEVDAKPNEAWPYEILLRHLEPPRRPSYHRCFVLAGSSGQNLPEMMQEVGSRPKGQDLLSRIPSENQTSIPPLGAGDRIVVAVSQLLLAASDEGRTIREIEKMALYYLATSPGLDSARRLRDFATACVRRIPPDDDRVRYDHLFNSGDPGNKSFWLKAEQFHRQLADTFVILRPGDGKFTGSTASEGERRLAAIMFTDIVAFTAMAQRDEKLTMELLAQHNQLLRSIFPRHRGREVKVIGDSFLVEFQSALEAVQCALDIQKGLGERNSSLPSERRVNVRIGIHVGDVIRKEGDIFGDAVNVSSRIQPLAEAGGICISEQVYDQVANKIGVPLVKLGPGKLKNVSTSIDVYKLSLPWEAPRSTAASGFEKNKVAILPLKSISSDSADEYFADGMTEELISAVSKIGELRTISRSSAMRFRSTDKSVTEIAAELHVGAVVEGSVRKAGNTVRINVQLVDVRNDEHLWSQSYDRQLEDIFAIQSDIASKVAEALQVHVLAHERERIERKATGNMESYTLYLKGLHHKGERNEESYRKAIQYFEEALRRDPGFSLPYSGLAECYDLMGDEGYLPPKESFLRAEEYARKALELDDSLAEAHATLGAVLQTFYYDQPAAEAEFRRALDLNPNYGRVCNSYGAYLACMGRLDEAVAEIGRAQELNPLALEVNNCAAVIFNCVNEFGKSVEACEKMLRVDENFLPAYQDLAEAYIEKSRFDDAIQVLQKALLISKGSAPVKARLGFAYARAGRSEDARMVLHELEESSKQKYVTPLAFAIVLCGLGEKDESIRWLEKACEERAGGVLSVKVRPMWASLRSEPDFNRLLGRMGLGQDTR